MSFKNLDRLVLFFGIFILRIFFILVGLGYIFLLVYSRLKNEILLVLIIYFVEFNFKFFFWIIFMNCKIRWLRCFLVLLKIIKSSLILVYFCNFVIILSIFFW